MKTKTASLSVLLLIIFGLFSCSEDKVKDKPFIKVPFAGLEPSFTNFQTDANKGGLLSINSGTTITIPEDAWTDSLGNSISGNVDIAYREFHDAVDIFLSGMPLSYDSAGTTHNLSTAGMFEFMATQNGKNLKVKPGKSIKVRMASYTDDPDYNFYKLDEKQKNYSYLGRTETEANPEIEKINKKIKKMQPRDPFPFNKNKYFALNYDALIDVVFNNQYWQNRDSKKPKRKAEKYGLAWSEIKDYNYSIKFHRVEFKTYEMVWERLSSRRLPKWARKSCYIDKVIKTGYNQYVFKLKSGEQKTTLKVRAVMPIKHLFALPPKSWQSKYDEVLAKIEEERKRLEAQNAAFRTFEITSTGTHNWDRVYHRKDKIFVKGDFKFDPSVNEQLADIDVFYFLDNNKSFVKIDNATADTLMLVPDKSARFLAVLSDTTAAVYTNEAYNQLDFEALATNKSFTFDMKTVPIRSRDDITKLIN